MTQTIQEQMATAISGLNLGPGNSVTATHCPDTGDIIVTATISVTRDVDPNYIVGEDGPSYVGMDLAKEADIQAVFAPDDGTTVNMPEDTWEEPHPRKTHKKRTDPGLWALPFVGRRKLNIAEPEFEERVVQCRAAAEKATAEECVAKLTEFKRRPLNEDEEAIVEAYRNLYLSVGFADKARKAYYHRFQQLLG